MTFITGAGIAKGPGGENDAMTLWVFKDRLRLDRYVIPKEASLPRVQGPYTIWTTKGRFSGYVEHRTPGSERPPARRPL